MSERRPWTKQDHEREAAQAVVDAFPEVAIVSMRDAPDADLVHRDGYHVGLEIVRLADERELTMQSRLRSASERIRAELQSRGVQGVYWVYYDIQQMFDDTDKRGWDRKVPARVAEFFASHGPTNVQAAELVSNGVTCIAHVETERAPRTFLGCGWRTMTEAGHTLAEIALASKHQKLTGYRANDKERHFTQYWLAMASLGPGTSEDGGFSMLLERRFETVYDRVLLLNHGPNGRLVGAQDVTPDRRS